MRVGELEQVLLPIAVLPMHDQAECSCAHPVVEAVLRQAVFIDW